MNTEHQLMSLLQYHTRPIDQQFVDRIIRRLEAKKRIRIRMLMSALVVAGFIAIPILVSMKEKFELLTMGLSLSPYVTTFFILSVFSFGAWLASDDF